jgi:predicted O-linked N-acetylglucosamine transferase (SPINDLY family)
LPNSPVAYANLLTALHFPDGVGPDEIYAEHLRWAERHARSHYPRGTPSFANDWRSARPLRVGYISPDFREYPASRFFEPLLAHHDRAIVRPQHHDAVMRRCQAYGHAWRDIAGMSDERVERIVRDDQIDVLVDLAGHMANPRLTLFGRRPAPVQVTYLGYPSTTGLGTMDYRFTDSLHDPPGQTERWHTERLVRLDPCCWCYRPDDDAPDVSTLPALSRGGRVTFAAFNRPAKASPRILALWARVLATVPGSRLMALVAPGAETDAGLLRSFDHYGIGSDRLTLVERRPRADYVRLWGEVDLALDTFPYHGMTTTCDGLWMGVPTVTLAGNTHVSRVGVSLLGAVDLGDFIAQDDAGYVAAAVNAVGDLTRLTELRAGLRARMQRSPLRDEVGLTRRVEAVYRTMWRELYGNKI